MIISILLKQNETLQGQFNVQKLISWYHFIEKLIHKNLSKEIKRHSSSSFNKQEWKNPNLSDHLSDHYLQGLEWKTDLEVSTFICLMHIIWKALKEGRGVIRTKSWKKKRSWSSLLPSMEVAICYDIKH